MVSAGHVPDTVDLLINKGEDFDETLLYSDSLAAPINLTGFTARAYIKTSITAADPPVVALTTANSRITLGGAAGTIRLQIDDAVTDLITLATTADPEIESGVWDLEVASAAGLVTKVAKGTVTAYKQVTTGTT